MTQDGDLWTLGDHLLLCADSLTPETWARDDIPKRAAAVVTDPPYAIYGSSTGIAEDITDDRMVRPFFEAVFRLIHERLGNFGHAYVFCDWRSWASLWEPASRPAAAASPWTTPRAGAT